jgi:hypothetical protein
MKQIIGLYLFIGLCFTPLIYSNNAYGYRDTESKSYAWGQALGASLLYWPSYLFSIEPELDANSIKSFTKSVEDVIQYRNDKLFTGKRSSSHGLMVLTAIGYCILSENAFNNSRISYKKIFNNNDGQDFTKIQNKIMVIFDGDDFSDIIAQGVDCFSSMSK